MAAFTWGTADGEAASPLDTLLPLWDAELTRGTLGGGADSAAAARLARECVIERGRAGDGAGGRSAGFGSPTAALTGADNCRACCPEDGVAMGGKAALATRAAALPAPEPERGAAAGPAEASRSSPELTASGAAINSARESVGMLPCAAPSAATDSRALGFTARRGAEPGSGVDTKRCSAVAVAAAAEKSTSST